MKRISLLGYMFLAMMAVLFYTSCEDDGLGGGGGNTDAPVIELNDDGSGYITGNVTVDPGQLMTINLSGFSNGSDLHYLVFLEGNDTIMDYSSRITIEGDAAWANPILMEVAWPQTFNWIVTINAHTDFSTKEYRMILTDKSGFTDETSFFVTVEEPVITYPGPLSLDYVSGVGCFVTDAVDAEPGSTACFALVGVRGSDATLGSLTILENGVAISDLTRLSYNGGEVFGNPSELPISSENGFNYDEISIKLTTEEGVTNAYSFILTDTLGNSTPATTPINITTKVTGTPITGNLSGALLNAGGPAGTGGLDLDTGTGTGSLDPDAEIRDLGINLSEPAATNWYQQVAPANDAKIRIASPGSEFPFDFDGAAFKEQIKDGYDIIGTDPGATPVVNIGDVFLVKRGTNYYAIKCTNVQVKPDQNDNSDFYEFSIKY